MLLRNIDHSLGLCNGTILVVTKLDDHVLEATILQGSNAGELVLIPRMKVTPSDPRLPFKFQQRQIPVILSYAMTINKSQGQSLSHVGLFLKKPVFSHGQLSSSAPPFSIYSKGAPAFGNLRFNPVFSIDIQIYLKSPPFELIISIFLADPAMDLMKVFDQTVREIKREVNLKVLKVPEIEQKVLDATDDEPWGPHGTVLAEIAQGTKKFTECQMIMNVLWSRLIETGKNWRFVYKSLTVIEYLVAHGSERAVDDIIEHTFKISSLASFEYVEPSGKDVGINVRKKAETIVALLNNKDKIQEVRNKAAANREKYVGLSSSGITFKSGAASFSSTGFKNNDRYGGFGNRGDSETFKDSYKDADQYGEDKYVKTAKSKKESSHYGSMGQNSTATGTSKTSKPDKYSSSTSQNAPPSDKYDEDFDDFDPRGTSSDKPSSGSPQVDLFGQDYVGDLLDGPIGVPTDNSTSLDNDPSEVDLFADADFVSAPPLPAGPKNPEPQPAPSPAVSTTMDFFAAPDPPTQLDNKASKPDTTNNVVDPFANVPLNSFDGSDPFGAFTSHTDPLSTAANSNSSNDVSNRNVKGPSTETKPPVKSGFQVKSGIWADSLSRGLIDLNITAPKKVNLADVGIVGGLTDGSDEKDKGPLPPFYMGKSMGVGSGIGMSGFTSNTTTMNDDFFSSLGGSQYQYGGFQK
ncbi:clathrin interactor epsin 1 [Phtheirospermum japonicum]|uniref:Clathrin interactor epsin 1 n=1 Tax=Phtheirospermum japonicum TaxID=374723 RepID=A0A830C176_9LAMI|nr:clathrin interactor epsin 1 [Phtheirospermum japonicum]